LLYLLKRKISSEAAYTKKRNPSQPFQQNHSQTPPAVPVPKKVPNCPRAVGALRNGLRVRKVDQCSQVPPIAPRLHYPTYPIGCIDYYFSVALTFHDQTWTSVMGTFLH